MLREPSADNASDGESPVEPYDSGIEEVYQDSEDEKEYPYVPQDHVSDIFLQDLKALRARLYEQEGAISIFNALENENDEKTEELLDEATKWLLSHKEFVFSPEGPYSPKEIAQSVEQHDPDFHFRLLKGFAEENDVVLKELLDIVVQMEEQKKKLKSIPMVIVDPNAMLGMTDDPLQMQSQLDGFILDRRQVKDSTGMEKTVCEGCHTKVSVSTQARHIEYRAPSIPNKTFCFHSDACVALRQYKEAIRRYVLLTEAPKELTSLTDYVLYLYQNIGILLEIDVPVVRPQFKKPKQQLALFKRLQNQTERNAATAIDMNDMNSKEMSFRRRRQLAQVFLGRERKMPTRNRQSSRLYREWGSLDAAIRYMDVYVYGESLWGVIATNLLTKNDRPPVWKVYRFIAVELPAPVVIRLLSENPDDLSKYKVDFLQSLTLGVIEGAAFPMAVALKMSAFMKDRAELDQSREEEFNALANLIEKVAIKFVGDIESDHLLALLLLLPSDVEGLSTLELALKYNSFGFLDNSRISAVSSQMMSQYEMLNPNKQFRQSDLHLGGLFKLALRQPTRFFLTPQGQNLMNAVLYIVYLIILTSVVFPTPQYPFDSVNALEFWFWITNMGFIGSVVSEMASSGLPIVWMVTNPQQTVLALGWSTLAVLRFGGWRGLFRVKSDPFTPYGSRNEPVTLAYITIFGSLLVASYTRGLRFFSISNSVGPMVKMIQKMIGDILNFGLLLAIFVIGLMFALWYIFGGDYCDYNSLWKIFLFIFDMLVGATGIGNIVAQPANNLDPTNPTQSCFGANSSVSVAPGRARLAMGLVLLMSFFLTVLMMNLLIAIMASTYEYVQNNARSEVVYARVKAAYEYKRNLSLLPPPFNVVVLPASMTWVFLSVVINVVSCGKYDFNVNPLQPIHYDPDDKEDTTDLSCFGLLRVRRQPGLCTNPFDKAAAHHCRYCYQEVSDESPTLDDYIKLFKRFKFDQNDLELLRHLMVGKQLCNHCFMPYYRNDKGTDLLTKFDLAQQTLSYYVYIVLLYLPLLMMLALPSILSLLLFNARQAVLNLEAAADTADTSTTESYRENVVEVIKEVRDSKTLQEEVQDLRVEIARLDKLVGTKEMVTLREELKDLKVMLAEVLGDRLSAAAKEKLRV